MKSIFTRSLLITFFAIAAQASARADADHYPSRPVTVVVPNAAGGPTDRLARVLGRQLSRAFGQPVLIDAKGGAAGMIASEFVARAKPDGYTLLLATTGPMAINPAMYPKLRYDPQKDFEPVGMISTASNVLVVRNNLPVKDVKDLIVRLKREPDRFTFGSTGSGSANHVAAEMFKAKTGTQIRHVPYKSASSLKVDLFEGRIDMVFAPEGSAYHELVQAGKARALLVSGTKRSRLFPDVLTAEEAGMKDFDVTIWFGLAAPAGTPPAVVNRLSTELANVLNVPEVRKYLADEGQTAVTMNSQQFGAFMLQERSKWVPVVKASGATTE